jgi:hypothetical protein
MKSKKKKSNAGRPKLKDAKQWIGLRASPKGKKNCEDIAARTGQSFSAVVSLAMEVYTGGEAGK